MKRVDTISDALGRVAKKKEKGLEAKAAEGGIQADEFEVMEVRSSCK